MFCRRFGLCLSLCLCLSVLGSLFANCSRARSAIAENGERHFLVDFSNSSTESCAIFSSLIFSPTSTSGPQQQRKKNSPAKVLPRHNCNGPKRFQQPRCNIPSNRPPICHLRLGLFSLAGLSGFQLRKVCDILMSLWHFCGSKGRLKLERKGRGEKIRVTKRASLANFGRAELAS